MNNFKKLETGIIIAVIAVIGIAYGLLQDPVVAPVTENQNQDVAGANTSQIKYQGQDGRTALDLLKVFYGTETKSTSFGDMVVAINGVKADESKEFWAFYLNGSMAQEGAGTYVTKSTDSIEWKLESF